MGGISVNRILKRAAIAAIASTSIALSAASAKADEFINVLTGGTSGVYYPLGVALSKIYGEKIEGARTQVQATKASVENLNLLQQGRGEIAFALGDSVKLAWEGDTEAGFKAPLDKLRGIAAIYPNYIQIMASKESGIKTVADFKGKSLSVGAPKSGTELNARAILGAAGMSYDDLGKTEYLPFAESVELMKNRQLDATLQSAGLGVSSFKALYRRHRPRRHLQGPGQRCADGCGRQLPRHPFRGFRRNRLSDDQAALREPAGSRGGSQGGGEYPHRGRAERYARSSPSWRRALLQGKGPALTATACILKS
jgi:TRAP transporter TAXI family solute receptor